MKFINIFYLFVAGLFFTSCALMFKEELSFDKTRVPGEYQGTISCSYEPCDIAGATNFMITEGETYFTLQFEDSVSNHIPNLEFKIELGDESFGEAVTVSGFIFLNENQFWQLTPYDEHLFYYWTYYDTQQEGERFEIRIYDTENDNDTPNPDYLELNGYKGIQ
jgi:hypothetical protein